MTPHERLRAARDAALGGLHEVALQEYIWFFHHALAEQPSLSGVRRSFALSYWIDLGADYPPALRALEGLRDDCALKLLRGDAGLAVFRDVTSINHYLEATERTYELYKSMMEAVPELAKSCGEDALPAIVQAKDFRLALQLLPERGPWVHAFVNDLNHQMRITKSQSFSRAPSRWAKIGNSGGDLRQMLNVLTANGLHSEASHIRKLALSLIQSPSVRRDLAAELVRPAKAPQYQSFKQMQRAFKRRELNLRKQHLFELPGRHRP